MIIQCPDCGFSGRIPHSALGRSHHATCPKCRNKFTLRTPAGAADPGGPRAFPPFDNAESAADDPGSSSYELRAITDDIGAGSGVVDTDSLAGTIGSEAARAGDDLLDRPENAVSGLREITPSPGSAVVDPWYSRLLQLWGIVLLIWAALILGRDLRRVTPSVGGSQATGHLLSTVIAVLLLVAGAAGLFMAVDFGRSLRAGVRPAASSQGPSRPAFSHPISMRFRRFWHRPSRRAQPVRT